MSETQKEPAEREKTPPDMEAGANEEDGTFISISLADDPGRPREISEPILQKKERNVNISRRWLKSMGGGAKACKT